MTVLLGLAGGCSLVSGSAGTEPAAADVPECKNIGLCIACRNRASDATENPGCLAELNQCNQSDLGCNQWRECTDECEAEWAATCFDDCPAPPGNLDATLTNCMCTKCLEECACLVGC